VSVATVAVLTLLPGVEPAMVLGAFSGAVVFVMASDELSAVKKIGYFIPSFLGGLLAAKMVADILSSMMPSALPVNTGVGALLASTLVVKTLLWLLARDPTSVIEFFRGIRR
ncbi:MAG: alkaline phosphatase, partial [Rhodocyclaceae bacterium]|nr:alkaline phosphatase [Rhodocyclaceae bacterium]